MEKYTELSHKKRTVADLVRYIANISPVSKGVGTPNFTLFLGAGASITSGIRSGGQLINQWKQDIYDESDKSISLEDYYTTKSPDWYDESNPYASLFEHRFDLQRQRRILVEKEVAGKTPSIGYAYLVNLIEQGYFNTVFTTNFDDLLNEAFYRFSFVRPIVCAHDSSISGVTITSSRPKIIKLHGDYLFDNIKATLRETESLEQNMRMKFQEFAKDYGLIIIGYSGQDRSIRDILNYLLQHDDYLKNGVYWCIKKGELTTISAELKKLLWQDKVYIIEIDGFDELMAEINSRLLKGELPIKQELMTRSYQEKIIDELTENEYLKETPSTILQNDCQRLKQGYKDQSIKDLINFTKDFSRETKTESPNVRIGKKRSIYRSVYAPMDVNERKKVEDLQEQLYVFKRNADVIEELDNMSIMTLSKSQYKLELLELYVDAKRDIDDLAIKTYYDELILLQPIKQTYYIIASRRSVSFNQKCSYLERAVEMFKNDYFVYNQLAELLVDKYVEVISGDEYEKSFSRIEELLDKSIELRPEIGNDAYLTKIRYYKKKFANQIDIRDSKMCEVYDSMCILSKYHPNILQAAILLKKESNEMFNTSMEYYEKADNLNLLEESLRLCLLSISNEKIDKKIELITKYNKDYVPSDDFLWVASKIFKDNEYFDDALSTLDLLADTPDLYIRKMQILSYFDKTNKLEEYYNSIPHTPRIDFEYYELTHNYEKALEIYLNHIYDEQMIQETQLMTYSYLLLQLKRYEEVEKLLKKYYDSPMTSSPPIIVNYLFAKKKIKVEYDITTKLDSKLLNAHYISLSTLEYVAVYALKGDRSNLLKYLKLLIKEFPEEKYNIVNWPIMEKYKDDNAIKSIIAPNHKHINIDFKI